MPAFDLPADTIDALATMIASWNAVAAKASVPGDAAAGRQFFFGKGQCASCHLAQGEGSAIGPDLSDIALTLTVDEIRDALLNPDARIAPGYGLVSVRLRNGRTLRGFARSRSSFDLAVQDLTGAFHTLSLDDVASITDEKTSHMAAVKASADELRDVIAFLSRLTGVRPGAGSRRQPAFADTGIDFSRILNPKAGEWPTFNGNVSGNRYSPLTQINKSNVSKLSVKWTFSIPLWSLFHPDTPYYRQNMRYFGLETVPIVADGVMYVTGPNQVFALDPRTGHQIWHYSRPRIDRSGFRCVTRHEPRRRHSRRSRVHGHRQRASDCAASRHRPPRLGGRHARRAAEVRRDHGAARRQGHGDRRRLGRRLGHPRIPCPPTKPPPANASGATGPFRPKAIRASRRGRERPSRRAAAATWQTGSYDPETDTLYWATGNPWPNSDDRERGGDNLFTDCVLALDPATGKLKWYYQFTPHDVRDWDANAAQCPRQHDVSRRRSESSFCMRTGTAFSTSSIAPTASCCSRRNSSDG